MKRTLLFVLSLALLTAVASKVSPVSAQDAAPVPVATDGAFRDGLYLGGLDRANGRASHISIGRWAADGDRMQFRAGYEAGYRNAISAQ
jgi:hypothetical protein